MLFYPCFSITLRTVNQLKFIDMSNKLEELKRYEKLVQTACAELEKYKKLYWEDGVISKDEQQQLDKMEANIKVLTPKLEALKIEGTLGNIKKAIEGNDAAQVRKDMGELCDCLVKASSKNKKEYQSEIEAVYEKSAPLLSQSSDKSATTDEHECGDYFAWEWNPMIRIAYYSPSCTIQYANLDINSKKAYTGPWERDDVNTALFKVFSTVVIYRVGKIFKKVEALAITLGMTNAALQGYTGLHVRYRIKGETINLHNWYGKYKYNLFNAELLAVDYKGKSEAHLALIAPFQVEYGLFDADGTCLGTTSDTFDFPGINIDDYTVLPERSFGEF